MRALSGRDRARRELAESCHNLVLQSCEHNIRANRNTFSTAKCLHGKLRRIASCRVYRLLRDGEQDNSDWHHGYEGMRSPGLD